MEWQIMEVGLLVYPLWVLFDLFLRPMKNFCRTEPLKISQAESSDN